MTEIICSEKYKLSSASNHDNNYYYNSYATRFLITQKPFINGCSPSESHMKVSLIVSPPPQIISSYLLIQLINKYTTMQTTKTNFHFLAYIASLYLHATISNPQQNIFPIFTIPIFSNVVEPARANLEINLEQINSSLSCSMAEVRTSFYPSLTLGGVLIHDKREYSVLYWIDLLIKARSLMWDIVWIERGV